MSGVCKLDAKDKKLAIFSDTHLYHRFNLAQFEFIKGIVESVDQVIINGDFWDHYETTFEQFISSQWQQLFTLLKQKKTIYVYGNHDATSFSDERVNFFSDQQVDECLVEVGQYLLRVKHGHQAVPSWDVKHPRLFKNKPMLKLGNIFQLAGVSLFGEGFLKVIFTYWNWIVKKCVQQWPENEILVCGHTHLAEFNLAKKYINNGVIRWGLGQYLLVDRGDLNLVRGRYR